MIGSEYVWTVVYARMKKKWKKREKKKKFADPSACLRPFYCVRVHGVKGESSLTRSRVYIERGWWWWWWLTRCARVRTANHAALPILGLSPPAYIIIIYASTTDKHARVQPFCFQELYRRVSFLAVSTVFILFSLSLSLYYDPIVIVWCSYIVSERYMQGCEGPPPPQPPLSSSHGGFGNRSSSV